MNSHIALCIRTSIVYISISNCSHIPNIVFTSHYCLTSRIIYIAMADIFHISLHVAITFFTFLSLRVAITFVTFLSLNIDNIKNCILFTRIIIVLSLVKIQSVISSTSIQQNWYAWVVCFWAFYRQSCNSMGDVIGMWRTYCNAERTNFVVY
jgi:hypothetical protein